MTRIATVEQLARSLAKALPAIIWISSDEPLLAMEAADSVRSRARALGFSAEADFDEIIRVYVEDELGG